MSLIESYAIEESGFHPFLIRDSWQVAKLNYTEEWHIDAINCLKILRESDRAFVLLKGSAVLVALEDNEGKSAFKVELMKRGASYNIPKNTWYAIALEKESEVLIVGKPNTHLDNVEYVQLNAEQLLEMRYVVKNEFKCE